MRWRTTLVTALALFVAASCSDEPTAPPELSNLAIGPPGLTPAVVFKGWFPGEEVVWEACGEEHTYVGTDHIVIRETETPSGIYKWGIHINSRAATVTSESGNVYSASPWAWSGWFSVVDGTDRYLESNTSTLIAHGVNVDGKLWWKWRFQLNNLESGEVIVDREIDEGGCT